MTRTRPTGARTPATRIRAANDRPVRKDASRVVYWMTAARRTRDHFGLQRAVEESTRLGLPLVVLEPLRCGHPWASARFHAFILRGMRENAARFRKAGVLHHAYVEPEPGAGKGLLAAWAKDAALVVTDDYPASFHPRMLAAAARQLDVRLEAVDANGAYPLSQTRTPPGAAVVFRRALQKSLLPHLLDAPAEDPLDAYDAGDATMPDGLAARWPQASRALLAGGAASLRALPLDHDVPPVALPGGLAAAQRRADELLQVRLDRYLQRDEPAADAASGLSPYLHFGHLSAHRLALRILEREGWNPARTRPDARGAKEWWGVSPQAEAYLDQLVVWRELGYHYAARDPTHATPDSLPEWAKATLRKHAHDPRKHLYTHGELERGETHDELWNAAQRELTTTGLMHNRVRMLWGKKILEWTRSPEDAAKTMIALNDRWALDGRDPNSYTGIYWVLGRFDRPWPPEKPILGVLRPMSSERMRAKIDVEAYVRRYGRHTDSRRAS